MMSVMAMQYQTYRKNHSNFIPIWEKGEKYNSLGDLYKTNYPFYNNGDKRVELVNSKVKKNGISIDIFRLIPHKDSSAFKNPDKFFEHFHSIKIVPILKLDEL